MTIIIMIDNMSIIIISSSSSRSITSIIIISIIANPKRQLYANGNTHNTNATYEGARVILIHIRRW